MPLLPFNYKKANSLCRKKVWVLVCLISTLFCPVLAQPGKVQWVDSVFQTLSFEAKIGQLIMMPIKGTEDESEKIRIEEIIKTYGIGGIVFTAGGPVNLATLTTHFKSRSAIPILVGLNAEEGLGSTLDSTLTFPPTLMLGAIKNDSMLYYYGLEVGRQMKELGIHLAFAPTADLSTTYLSVDRMAHTFGDNPERVAKGAVHYMKGLQHAGIIPVAKHFPSYSLKVKDYYKDSPVMELRHDDQKSLIPLKRLIENGCEAIFASTLHDPVFPDRRKIGTKKKRIIPEALPMLYTADYLKKNLNFKGLVFSYVPDVKIVLRKSQAGDSEVYAFLAGNDILLFPENITATIRKLKRQLKKNPALSNQLNERVKKVLAFKYDAGLTETVIDKPVETLVDRLNTIEARMLQHTLYEQSITIARDDNALLPLKILDNKSFASLSIGERKENEFSHHLSKYTSFDNYEFSNTEVDTILLIEELKKYSVVVAGIFLTSSGVKNEYPSLLNTLAQYTQVIVCNLGPHTKIEQLDPRITIVQAYMDDALLRKLIPQTLFGALPGTGILPLSINDQLREGQSIQTPALGRLGYAIPESVGISSRSLERISTIAREAIDSKSTPGCQVIVAKNGKVIYEKSFGWYTYDNQVPVTDHTIYDLASVTKVFATLQSVMFLYDKGLIDINKKVSVYLPELKSTNKKDIILKDVLTHQAGLLPFIPLWQNTMKNEKEFLPLYYSRNNSNNYPLQVAPDLFAAPVLKDSLWKWTFHSKMLERTARTPYPYRYSDIGFWILHRMAERLLNQPIEDFLTQNIFEPLGASTMGYVPLSRFPVTRIAPTEFDNTFRKSMIVGTVHDERAAMMGGVAGHAGLFSTAHDVAKMAQMLLQKGYYGGHHYIKPETIDLFTKKQFESSRRGLGWDKPIQSDWTSPTSLYASPQTFGHTGFTGTCVWIDPEFDLVYIFLSNRVFPDRSAKLISSNIRSRIQDIIYQSIFDYCQYQTPTLWSGLK
jgi:beta-N-acetylhexosaminidase